MHIQFHPYVIYLVISVLICTASALIVWRRSAPGASTLGWVLIVMSFWAGSDMMQLLQGTRESKIFWLDGTILGMVVSPVLFLIFCFQFTHRERLLTPRNIFLLLVMPLASLILIVTNDNHHLFLRSIDTVKENGLLLLKMEKGPWYFINTLYTYTILILGFLTLILESFRSSPLYRNQFRLILLGCIPPFFLTLFGQFAKFDLPLLDPAPLTFGFTGVIFLIAYLRTGFLDLVPVARSRLIENMQDGVLVLDSQHRVVDINTALEKFLDLAHGSALGKTAFDILGSLMGKTDALLNGLESHTEMKIPNDPLRYLDLKVTPLHSFTKNLNGHLIVFRDVTERKDVERKLRNANYRLQTQLIEIGILQSQLREQAIHDPLTNLFNRRYLEETLDRELARARRESYPVSIFMIDIDHFKRVNDAHGHEAGDLLLKALADRMTQHSRVGDFVCRYGGEEFVIVMPNMTSEVAHSRAHLLRDSLKELSVTYHSHSLSATYSMGIASFPTHGKDRTSLIHSADQAMYAAKNAGRDHIFMYSEIGQASG